MARLFREDTPRFVFTKRRIVIGVAALLAIAGGIVAYILISNQIDRQANNAFVIDGKAYSKDEVRSLVKYSTQRGTNEEDAAKAAFEYLKRQTAAKKAGIEMSETKLTEATNALFPDSKDAYDPDGAPWIELVSYDEALKRELTDRRLTDASGYVFIFPFDRLMQTANDYMPEGYGDEARIAEDRSYAQSRSNYYQDAIEKSALSPEDALKEMQADARLGQLGMVNANTSVRFDGFVSGDVTRPERYVGDDAADQVIKLSNKKGVGEVNIGKTTKGETAPKSEDDYQEAYYYFVMIDKPSTTTQDKKSTFEAALKNISANYKGLS